MTYRKGAIVPVETENERWPFPFRPRMQFFVCTFRGHRFVSLRWNQRKVDNLGHLHRYAGYDAQCRTCGVRWKDTEDTSFNEMNSVRIDGWRYKLLVADLDRGYSYLPWKHGDPDGLVVEEYEEDLSNRANPKPRRRDKPLLHAPRLRWWQLWSLLRAWWFLYQRSAGLSQWQRDFYEQDNYKPIVRHFLSRKERDRRKKELKSRRHPTRRRSLGPGS